MQTPECAVFIHEPPTIEINNHIVVVRDGTGRRAMSVRTAQRGMERIQQALRRHAAGEEHVIIDE